jgi:hypothetical protein
MRSAISIVLKAQSSFAPTPGWFLGSPSLVIPPDGAEARSRVMGVGGQILSSGQEIQAKASIQKTIQGQKAHLPEHRGPQVSYRCLLRLKGSGAFQRGVDVSLLGAMGESGNPRRILVRYPHLDWEPLSPAIIFELIRPGRQLRNHWCPGARHM